MKRMAAAFLAMLILALGLGALAGCEGAGDVDLYEATDAAGWTP